MRFKHGCHRISQFNFLCSFKRLRSVGGAEMLAADAAQPTISSSQSSLRAKGVGLRLLPFSAISSHFSRRLVARLLTLGPSQHHSRCSFRLDPSPNLVCSPLLGGATQLRSMLASLSCCCDTRNRFFHPSFFVYIFPRDSCEHPFASHVHELCILPYDRHSRTQRRAPAPMEWGIFRSCDSPNLREGVQTRKQQGGAGPNTSECRRRCDARLSTPPPSVLDTKATKPHRPSFHSHFPQLSPTNFDSLSVRPERARG